MSINPWNAYLDEQKYLPEWMRDFHAQKMFFKVMHRFAIAPAIDKRIIEEKITNRNIDALSWVDLHILTVDSADVLQM